ncbi:alpha/beta hydrolase [Thalassomonas sp. M1454]|uniref:alpha/beta hydrolase n=1 Tax=Thalassomonas sp. M1454 TaxID=2594477 RepID=UPI00117E4B60|nr:alpha/beta hydrolase [Thalassomonas sp. M1454]TRX56537.1 alpha/beta hydrolase [Thalassomonas sp. M1454]
MHCLNKLLISFLLLCISGCSTLFFYPEKQLVRTPEQVGLAYQDVDIKVSDEVSIHGWFLPVEDNVEVKGTVYFLHGNAQNISTHLRSVYWLPERGYQVFLIDYRGYGKSTGEPLIPDVFHDINAGFLWLIKQPSVQQKPIYLLGQSLGASMSGYLVGTQPEMRDRLSGVILDAGFTSYSEIARHIASDNWLTWLFQYPAAWSMPSDYDLIDVVQNISPTPLLIVHGTQDVVIPYQHGKKLLAKAKQPKAFLSYTGGHIATFNDVGNQNLLLEFMQKFTPTKP